ncbi:MAG: 50S ribosomal protein L15 [Candidatus Gracilibacteria bacterium]|nr:50S ribosomal protein L15 [Candidatus Gracilibacteria bacterium]
MRQDTLKPAQKRKVSKRLGRGNASGKGTFCGRGCKGQGQRKSGNVPSWFEGGQTPLHQRLPKLRGFKNFRRVAYQAVNLRDLENLSETKIDNKVLHQAGLIPDVKAPTKLLATGELKKKIEIEVSQASAQAIAKVEKAGGKVILPAAKEAPVTAKKATAKK